MKIVDVAIGLCANHSEVCRRVKEAYSIWFNAYSNLTFEVFLKRLIALPETGDRAREMAQFLIRNTERWK